MAFIRLNVQEQIEQTLAQSETEINELYTMTIFPISPSLHNQTSSR